MTTSPTPAPDDFPGGENFSGGELGEGGDFLWIAGQSAGGAGVGIDIGEEDGGVGDHLDDLTVPGQDPACMGRRGGRGPQELF